MQVSRLDILRKNGKIVREYALLPSTALLNEGKHDDYGRVHADSPFSAPVPTFGERQIFKAEDSGL